MFKLLELGRLRSYAPLKTEVTAIVVGNLNLSLIIKLI